jgi:hypothetical protein
MLYIPFALRCKTLREERHKKWVSLLMRHNSMLFNSMLGATSLKQTGRSTLDRSRVWTNTLTMAPTVKNEKNVEVIMCK